MQMQHLQILGYPNASISQLEYASMEISYPILEFDQFNIRRKLFPKETKGTFLFLNENYDLATLI